MFEIGDKVNHSVFGKGEIIYLDEGKDFHGHPIHYVDVHFDNDEKYQVRRFTEQSLLEFLPQGGGK